MTESNGSVTEHNTYVDELAQTLCNAGRYDPAAWYILGEPGRETYRTMAYAALAHLGT